VTVVFDASTVLAILQAETGSDTAIAEARGALLSAVNLIEVRSKIIDATIDPDAAIAIIDRLELVVVPFTAGQATIAADLWPAVKGKRVSLADRACLALAIDRGLPVVTGDRKWLELDFAVDVRLFR
jgi:ribonuclease VapC